MNETNRTRERLLDAGRQLFADRGFDGASVRAITQGAHANLGAVTYHFGSKAALYEAVLAHLFASLAERVRVAAAEPGAARLRLAGIVRAFFAFFQAYPEAPALLLHHLAGGGPPPEAAVLEFRRVPEAIMALVRDGQARGELRGVDPLLATFTLMSQAVWFAIARRTIARVSGVPMDRPEMAAVVERHIIDVISRTLDPAKEAP